MCFIITGLTTSSSCNEAGYGGLASKRFYLCNKESVTAIGKNATTGVITGVTISGSDQFYAFDAIKETNQLNEDLVKVPNTYVKQTLIFNMRGITQARKKVLDKLAKSEVVAIVEYDNNFYKLIGEDFPLEVVTAPMTSGAGPDDFKGVIVTMEGKSSEYANEITSAAVALAIA